MFWTGKGAPAFPLAVLLGDLAYPLLCVAAYMYSPEALACMLFGGLPLFFFNMKAAARYRMSHGAFYACTGSRYIILLKMFRKMKLVSVPRRVVEYVGISKNPLVLYNDILITRDKEQSEVPQGFLDLDDVEGARLALAEVPPPTDRLPKNTPKALHMGDIPLPVQEREFLEKLLEPGEKPLYAAAPRPRSGMVQVLDIAGAVLIIWMLYLLLKQALTLSAPCWAVVGTAIVARLLAKYGPVKRWRHRNKTFFLLSDRRAYELIPRTGKVLHTWEANNELIKKAVLYRNGCGSFNFSLDHVSTTRGDAGNSEDWVDNLPDARKLIAVINSLPQPVDSPR